MWTRKKTAFVLLGLLITTAAFFVYVNYRIDSMGLRDNLLHEKINIPVEIKEKADQYVAALVGNSEFKKNYKLVSAEQCDSPVYGCYIRYQFLPGARYGKSEYLFYYNNTTQSVSLANNDVPLKLPSCEQDKNKCSFALSYGFLVELARKEKLNDKYFQMEMRDGEIVISISYCDLNTTENRRKILIDPVDGRILWDGQNNECQGII